ncbi:MAG: DUF3786 domain-containing protein [Treponema sp.]|jgi:hypothetical protein|nr:DUF3786 domain-containing protein [Treponema sp.]
MNKTPPYEKDQKNQAPLAHYLGIYKTLDPHEIARRCALPFDERASAFSLRLMGRDYHAAFPGFELRDRTGAGTKSPYEKILLLRYLCEGKYFDSTGKSLAYNQIPWGAVYYPNFEGRCIRRFARSFGNDIALFRQIMEGTENLRAHALPQGDAGYRFEFINGLFMSLLLWAGDDEFPPGAQILFDDNFVFAFSAEDIAAVGEVVIERLTEFRSGF